MLICGIAVSFFTKSEKGFNLSIMIVCTPLILSFLLELIMPQIRDKNEISKVYSSLSPIEKFGSIINLLLICAWVIAQIYCWMQPL
ncbi:hypothetical protein C671_0367 [[Clostridium] bifermentans ATCC 19299]|nr:hypothetical protein C671_0367 [[Clostridium] bifermentans ATCC 19299] [Paraclostridium bifermentans ATCC 19299]